MGSVDQPRGKDGKWISGGSVGNQPVKSFAGQASVHTHLSAKQERIAMRQQADERRYPTRSDAQVAQMTDLIGTRTAPGKLDPRINDAVRAIVKRSA